MPGIDLGGVVVATTLPFRADPSAPAGLAVDYDSYAQHCDLLMRSGCRGVGPNGSLGEYSSLTDEERRRVVQVAVEAVDGRGIVVAGVHGVGWHQARWWTEQAARDGADGVLLLPPILYRANASEVIEHYTRVNEVGLPIMAYNNPFDTKVDLTQDIVAEIGALDNVVAIKEFSADIRRVLEIKEVSDLDVIAGADDLLLESLLMGATGWFAGYPNAFPEEAVEIYDLVQKGDVRHAQELYAHLVRVFHWDSRTEFVQAIKLSMDIAGNFYGGPTRPPRGPLSAEHEAQVRRETEAALAHLANRRPA